MAPLIALLGGHSGWLAAIVAWMGALRVLAKLGSERLQKFLEAAVLYAKEGGPAEDATGIAREHWLVRVLEHPAYRAFRFLVDYFCSIKLPRAFTTFLIAGLCVCALAGCGTVKVPTNTLRFTSPYGQLNIEHPQDFTGSNLVVSIETNGTARASFGYIHTANSPEVISKTASGQVAIIKAQGDAYEKAFKAGAEFVGTTGGTALKTAK